MAGNEHRYVVELFVEKGTSVGQASLKVDWGPAEEWARFQAMRRGLLARDEPGHILSILPRWLPGVGEPYIEGFRVSVATRGSGEVTTDFTSAYFKSIASEASSQFVKAENLKESQKLSFLITAFRDEALEGGSVHFRFEAEEVSPLLPVTESSLSESMIKAATHGIIDPADVPVFVPDRILTEAAELSRQAEAQETGGILIGHLRQDPSLAEMFVEVTAQMPARHTEADLTTLTFTAETWTEVQAAIDLRRRDEIMVGWWHSHPVREWCEKCPVERQRVCVMASDFLSAHDRALHRAVFPRAYSVALVANDIAAGDLTFSGFGWRAGLIEPRGFYVAGGAWPASRR